MSRGIAAVVIAAFVYLALLPLFWPEPKAALSYGRTAAGEAALDKLWEIDRRTFPRSKKATLVIPFAKEL